MVLFSSMFSEVWVRRSQVGPTILIATLCIALCLLNWTWLSGLEYGYFYGVFSDPPMNGFAVHGPNYYQSMNIWYLTITVCFTACVVFAVRRELDGFILRMAALCIAIYPYFKLLDFKYDVLVNSGRRDYSWLQNSLYIDGFCVLSVFILLCVEIMRIRSARIRTDVLNDGLRISPEALKVPHEGHKVSAESLRVRHEALGAPRGAR
jgi:hypothetical protein